MASLTPAKIGHLRLTQEDQAALTERLTRCLTFAVKDQQPDGETLARAVVAEMVRFLEALMIQFDDCPF